jgi:hypothetical protein
MSNNSLVSLSISIPEKYHKMLRRKAAMHNSDNPKDVTSATEIARNLLLRALEDIFINDPCFELERDFEQVHREYLEDKERNKNQ